MRPTLSALAFGLSLLFLAACDSSTSPSAGPLSAEEESLVGTWYAEVAGVAKVTFVLNADRTQKNTTVLNGKTFAENTGTWKASGGTAYFTNKKCQSPDTAGTLKDAPCGIVTDSTKVNVADGKWTINSNSTNKADVVFTKQ